MRSFLVVTGLALVAGVIALSGLLPSRAGASGAPAGIDSQASGGVEFQYADFAAEEPLVFEPRSARAEPDEPAAPPPPAPEPASPPDEPETPAPETATEEPSFDWPLPVADAGPDRTVWIGDGELQLDAGASTGDALTYSWRQMVGPNELKLADSTAAQTTAAGFPSEWTSYMKARYEFELTVTDVHGQQATETVSYEVKAAPTLTITPAPKRRLAERDGYLLAHFEAWKTNRTDYADTFEIRSPAELTFHQLSGEADFEITVSQSRDQFVYVVTVFYQDGQSSTWLEFFVDTPERVPVIVQLGVNWE